MIKSKNMIYRLWLGAWIIGTLSGGNAATESYVVRSPSAYSVKPLAFVDQEQKIMFYVESDGRHVTAVDFHGKILWHRDPFSDAKMEAYRTERPFIAWIGAPHADNPHAKKVRSIAIWFNSSQFGILSVEKGDFTFLGQD